MLCLFAIQMIRQEEHSRNEDHNHDDEPLIQCPLLFAMISKPEPGQYGQNDIQENDIYVKEDHIDKQRQDKQTVESSFQDREPADPLDGAMRLSCE